MDEISPIVASQTMSKTQIATNDNPQIMTNEWMTVEQAAIALGCSTRTIARRLKTAELETRTDDAGRRLVLVCRPQQKTEVTRTPDSDAVTGSSQLSNSNPVTGEIIAQALQVVISQTRDDAQRARDQAALAIAAAGIARKEARYAWGTVAALLIGLGVAGGIATHRITQQRAENVDLQRDVIVANTDANDAKRQASMLSSALTISQADTEKAREETAAARIDAARAQGEAHGMAEAIAAQPAPNPNLIDRMMAAIDK
jgi:hypothetical protein